MNRKGDIQSSDRRVKTTRRIIKTSFLSLIREMPFEKITVTAICKRADINRGTFYSYFLDPEDMFQQLQESMFNNIMKELKATYDSQTPLFDMVVSVLRTIQDDKDLCTVILNSKNDENSLLARILGDLKNKFIEVWSATLTKHLPDELIDYVFTFTSIGSIFVVKKWLETPNPAPVFEIAKLIETMGTSAILGVERK